MSSSTLALRQFRFPQTVIGRFVARRTVRSATLWALVFGAYVASKSIGYVATYPNAASRAKIAVSLGDNIGLRVLFGIPNHISTITGGVAWNTGSVMALIAAIWAFLLATKTLRGEEDAGRWELLLTGQTTARRAIVNALAGLSTSLLVLYVVAAAMFIGVGKVHTVDFSVSAALFFALSVVASAAVFIAVGALASQLMPTRSRAASLSAAILGLSFLLKAVASTTSVHWLLDVTPLGWIERMQPLSGSQPQWLIPIFGLMAVLVLLAVYLAGKHDLGASTFIDKDSARPRTMLLNTPLTMAVRLTRMSMLSWTLAIVLLSFFFGLLTKSAARIVDQSTAATHAFQRLGVSQASSQVGALAFLSIVFFLLMPFIMAYAASAVGQMREDEAEGYLDNLLVRPVGRLQWLWGRILLCGVIVGIASILGTVGMWAGEVSQHSGVPFHPLLLAGVSIMAPALCILGLGIFAFGCVPRLTTFVAYGVIGWSFLVSLLSSGLQLNHWLLDTSILQHMALAPSVNPNWASALILVAIGVVGALSGSFYFARRDVTTE